MANFSLHLALRNLNPKRSPFSGLTLLSVLGVMIGVTVLAVVTAVMEGFERDMKDRILAFTPHIELLDHTGLDLDGENHWSNVSEQAIQIQGVKSASGIIQDAAVIDKNGYQKSVTYKAFDTADTTLVARLSEMLDMETHPDSSADMGFEDTAVISSYLANEYYLEVGDTFQLISTKNFQDVLTAYKSTQHTVLSERFPDEIQQIKEFFQTHLKSPSLQVPIKFSEVNTVYTLLFNLNESNARELEKDLLISTANLLADGEDQGENFLFAVEALQEGLTNIIQLTTIDPDAEDLKRLKGLESLVLPRDVTVAGVYQASGHLLVPDLFIPLSFGQELLDYGDEVKSIALEIDQPYQAQIFAQQLNDNNAIPGWFAYSWVEQWQSLFDTFRTQEQMLGFVMSFVTLGSAFAIFAVMFLNALQRRREIGIMMAMGASRTQIVWLFLIQGFIVGILGVILGSGLTYLIIENRTWIQSGLASFGFDIFPSDFHGLNVIPAYLEVSDLININLFSLMLCWVAPLAPALYAVNYDAAKSLRS